ncbi:MAG: histidine phosphatase family protein [Spirochaetales bacterium]|nr:histidine phosphatase family protein [Spirochaetales bacterium]
MQLYLIRHGQSVNNHILIETGSSKNRHDDPDLTDTGKKQADTLARFLQKTDQVPAQAHIQYDVHNVNGFHFTHLYTSLMIRSIKTGQHIAERINLPLVALEDLHEEGGIFLKNEKTGEYIGQMGKSMTYFQKYFPSLILPDNLNQDGWWNRPFEPMEQRPLRARRVMQFLIAKHGTTDNRVACITHGGFYNCLVMEILNCNAHPRLWFSLNNAAISRFDIYPEERVGCYLNRIDFMPDELKTE